MEQNKNLGIGVGFVFCGLVLLFFPAFANLEGWIVWIFWLIGLILLLVGIMGACIELFGGDGHGE